MYRNKLFRFECRNLVPIAFALVSVLVHVRVRVLVLVLVPRGLLVVSLVFDVGFEV